MKVFLKRTAVGALAAVIFLFASALCSFAVTVDGACRRSEWEDSSSYSLKKQKSFNNEIKDCIVRTVYDSFEGCLYLCVSTEYKDFGNTQKAGIKLRVNSGEPVLIKLDGSVSGDCGYDIESASLFDEYDNVSVTEIALYFKDEMAIDDVVLLNIIDLEGKESATCRIEPEGDFTYRADETEPEETEENKTSAEKTAKEKAKTSAKSSKSKTGRNLSDYKKVTKTEASYSKKQSDKKTGGKKTGRTDVKTVPSDEIKSLDSVESNGFNKEYIIVAAGAVCAAAVSVIAVCAAVRSKRSKD